MVEAVRESGAPIKDVAERMGVKTATAYFWMKRARQAKAPEFAMVVPAERASGSRLRIAVGGAFVHLERGFDAELLCEVVAALSTRSS